MSMSDRIAVMNAGRIEQFSTPAALYARPETEFVATFIGSLNRLEGAFNGGTITRGSDVIGIRPEDVILATGPFKGAMPATVERIVPRGHFQEVYLQRADAQLRSFVTGVAPRAGQQVYAAIAKAMTFRDGRLIEETGAAQ
jgi:putative spermidine/putrescine transport system ATP-binding protein